MKTLSYACILGFLALLLGLLLFGQIEEEKIAFNRSTLEKVNSFGKAWDALVSQPLLVYIFGGAGFLVGGLTYLISSIRSKRREKAAAKAKGKDSLGLEIVPIKESDKSQHKRDLDRLEAERPFVCKILGFATLGLCKFYAVPQGNALVVTTYGKYRKYCKPGLGCIWSLWNFYQRPYSSTPLIQCKEKTIPYERETVVTSDGIRCKLDVMICYRIEDPGKALFEVDNYEVAIENVVRAILRNECGKQPAQALRASREQIASSLQEILEKDVEPWGIKVRLVKISNIDVPIQE